MSNDATRIRELLEQVTAALRSPRHSPPLLRFLNWERAIEEKFFADRASRLPAPSYQVDRDGLNEGIEMLAVIERRIEGSGSVYDWLRSTVRSLIDGDRLLLAAGAKEFYTISREIYGGARSQFIGGALTNVDLADHLLRRLQMHGSDEATDATAARMNAHEFAAWLQARLATRTPPLPIRVVVDSKCSAKVLAGARRVRIRDDATFDLIEAEGLLVHEIETHSLTAQNGAAQIAAPFLKTGGPRSTRTQEGLAVFAELYHRTLTTQRMQRLAARVKLIDMAESGASFIDLYRHLLDRGSAQRDAYLDAQRICRGGLVEGCAPFTKDACYLAGMLQVTAFLTAVVRGGFRDEIELLVSGRIDLDDVDALAQLRSMGLLKRPPYLPTWLASWETLLPYFAFTSFMDGIDLKPVETHYRELIEIGMRASPASRA